MHTWILSAWKLPAVDCVAYLHRAEVSEFTIEWIRVFPKQRPQVVKRTRQTALLGIRHHLEGWA